MQNNSCDGKIRCGRQQAGDEEQNPSFGIPLGYRVLYFKNEGFDVVFSVVDHRIFNKKG